MRILQLAPRIPYPLIDGGAIGIFKPTEAIAALGHEITFVTFPDSDPTLTSEALSKLQQFCRVELVNRPLPSRNLTLLKTMFSGAYPIERRMMPEMYDLLRRILAEEKYDLVHVDGAQMGKYGLWIKKEFGLPIILREHNFEALIYKRFAQTTRNPLARIIASIHAERVLRDETHFLNNFDGVIAISAEDKTHITQAAPKSKTWVIPAGVDTSFFQPQPAELEQNSILWVGGIDWEPNLDALEFFAKEMFPQIVKRHPEITWTIVGSGTQSLVKNEAFRSEKIKLLGRIPDIRGELGKAKVMICPLRVGGGMRLKLLDFFATGKAIVSTHIGAEGNLGIDGEHLLLRDDPQSFVDAVIMLFEQPEIRRQLGASARELAESTYSWQSVAEKFSNVYREVLSQ
ncbi:MAG: glycosyltransferase family 4 protein [bacterium]